MVKKRTKKKLEAETPEGEDFSDSRAATVEFTMDVDAKTIELLDAQNLIEALKKTIREMADEIGQWRICVAAQEAKASSGLKHPDGSTLSWKIASGKWNKVEL